MDLDWQTKRRIQRRNRLVRNVSLWGLSIQSLAFVVSYENANFFSVMFGLIGLSAWQFNLTKAWQFEQMGL